MDDFVEGKITMGDRDRISAILFLTISILVGVKASQFPFGNMKRLGPGFFPLMLAILLGVLSLILLVRSLRRGQRSAIEWPSRWSGLVFVSLAIFVFSLLLKPFGFLLTTVIFTSVAFKFADPGRWFAPMTAAFIATFVSYFVFRLGLGIPFPAGILGY
jgi:putative tricarboxylic transport membrane protein